MLAFVHWKNQGVSKADLDKIKAKYAWPNEFKPPDLTSGIQSNAAARHLKKEYWRRQVQEDLCPSLALFTAAMTLIMKEKQLAPSPFLDKLEDLLLEGNKLVANAIYQETESRKALVAPAFVPAVRGIIKKSPTDTHLFGGNIVEKAEEHFKLKNIMQNERNVRSVRNNAFFGNPRRGYPNRPPLMQQNPNVPYPMPQQMYSGVSQPTRPRSYSRGRRQNQPLNPRMLNRAGAAGMQVPK